LLPCTCLWFRGEGRGERGVESERCIYWEKKRERGGEERGNEREREREREEEEERKRKRKRKRSIRKRSMRKKRKGGVKGTSTLV
jgi:hypothetical protein